jgi:hypothetical protein
MLRDVVYGREISYESEITYETEGEEGRSQGIASNLFAMQQVANAPLPDMLLKRSEVTWDEADRVAGPDGKQLHRDSRYRAHRRVDKPIYRGIYLNRREVAVKVLKGIDAIPKALEASDS